MEGRSLLVVIAGFLALAGESVAKGTTLRRKKMRIQTILAVALASGPLFAQQPTPAREAPPSELPTLARFSPGLADRSVDPCNDFYTYVCRPWLAANPIPKDRPGWGTSFVLDDWNQTLLGQDLARLAKGEGVHTADEKKLGEFYGACMDEAGIEARGLESLEPELQRIAAIRA